MYLECIKNALYCLKAKVFKLIAEVMYLECIKNAIYSLKAKASKLITKVMNLECISNAFVLCIIFSNLLRK